MIDYAAILEHTQAQQESMVEALRELVDHESPSHDKPRLDRLARYLAQRFRDAGAKVDILEAADYGDHVRARFPASGVDEDIASGLLLCHFDTVWAAGTLAQRPFRVEDGRAWGPGTCDMKAGIVIAEYALRALAALGLPLRRPVTVFLNSDEEIGSRSSRALIEELAQAAAYALVLEPAMHGGALKTARKGIGAFTLKVEGRAAHAGAEPEKGVSAIEELAHQVIHLHSLSDMQSGTTLNVGVMRGGARSNVVAAQAEAKIDVRAWTVEEAQRIEKTLRALRPFHPEARLSLRGGFGRPPMERTPATVALFEQARTIGRALGFELTEAASGGGSDGNFCAALGVPTLDGLGPIGEGAHADHEHIEIEPLPLRAALLAGLLATL